MLKLLQYSLFGLFGCLTLPLTSWETGRTSKVHENRVWEADLYPLLADETSVLFNPERSLPKTEILKLGLRATTNMCFLCRQLNE